MLVEHDRYAVYSCDTTFINNSDYLEINSTKSGTGEGFIGAVFNSSWLHLKQLRAEIEGKVGIYIDDGEYNRTNSTDFPHNSEIPTKGVGSVQVLHAWDYYTAKTWINTTMDTSASTEGVCTLWVFFADSNAGTTAYGYIYDFWIQDQAGNIVWEMDIGESNEFNWSEGKREGEDEEEYGSFSASTPETSSFSVDTLVVNWTTSDAALITLDFNESVNEIIVFWGTEDYGSLSCKKFYNLSGGESEGFYSGPHLILIPDLDPGTTYNFSVFPNRSTGSADYKGNFTSQSGVVNHFTYGFDNRTVPQSSSSGGSDWMLEARNITSPTAPFGSHWQFYQNHYEIAKVHDSDSTSHMYVQWRTGIFGDSFAQDVPWSFGDGGSSSWYWQIRFVNSSTTGNFQVEAYNDSGGSSEYLVLPNITPSLNTWYNVTVLIHDDCRNSVKGKYWLYYVKFDCSNWTGPYWIVEDWMGDNRDFHYGWMNGDPGGAAGCVDFIAYQNGTFGTSNGTSPNWAPFKPTYTYPPSGSKQWPLTAFLSWEGGDIGLDMNDNVTYLLYLGNSTYQPYHSNTSAENLTLYGLNHSTTYFWRIVAKDNHNATTEGDLWNFTTSSWGDGFSKTVQLVEHDWGSYGCNTTFTNQSTYLEINSTGSGVKGNGYVGAVFNTSWLHLKQIRAEIEGHIGIYIDDGEYQRINSTDFPHNNLRPSKGGGRVQAVYPWDGDASKTWVNETLDTRSSTEEFCMLWVDYWDSDYSGDTCGKVYDFWIQDQAGDVLWEMDIGTSNQFEWVEGMREGEAEEEYGWTTASSPQTSSFSVNKNIRNWTTASSAALTVGYNESVNQLIIFYGTESHDQLSKVKIWNFTTPRTTFYPILTDLSPNTSYNFTIFPNRSVDGWLSEGNISTQSGVIDVITYAFDNTTFPYNTRSGTVKTEQANITTPTDPHIYAWGYMDEYSYTDYSHQVDTTTTNHVYCQARIGVFGTSVDNDVGIHIGDWPGDPSWAIKIMNATGDNHLKWYAYNWSEGADEYIAITGLPDVQMNKWYNVTVMIHNDARDSIGGSNATYYVKINGSSWKGPFWVDEWLYDGYLNILFIDGDPGTGTEALIDFVSYQNKTFTTSTTYNAIPYTPCNPTPAHNATGLNITLTLSWSGGHPDPDANLTYDVYFNTSSSPSYYANTTNTNLSICNLSLSTTYYWKIISKDQYNNTAQGDVWNFTTISGPYKPYDPTPPTGSIARPSLNFSWKGGHIDGLSVKYDICFGTTSNPSIKYTNLTSANFSEKSLHYRTTYYWKVVSKDNLGNTTEGYVWNFTIPMGYGYYEVYDLNMSSPDHYNRSDSSTGWHIKNAANQSNLIVISDRFCRYNNITRYMDYPNDTIDNGMGFIYDITAIFNYIWFSSDTVLKYLPSDKNSSGYSECYRSYTNLTKYNKSMEAIFLFDEPITRNDGHNNINETKVAKWVEITRNYWPDKPLFMNFYRLGDNKSEEFFFWEDNTHYHYDYYLANNPDFGSNRSAYIYQTYSNPQEEWFFIKSRPIDISGWENRNPNEKMKLRFDYQVKSNNTNVTNAFVELLEYYDNGTSPTSIHNFTLVYGGTNNTNKVEWGPIDISSNVTGIKKIEIRLKVHDNTSTFNNLEAYFDTIYLYSKNSTNKNSYYYKVENFDYDYTVNFDSIACYLLGYIDWIAIDPYVKPLWNSTTNTTFLHEKRPLSIIDEDANWTKSIWPYDYELLLFGQAYDHPAEGVAPFFEVDNWNDSAFIMPDNTTTWAYYEKAQDWDAIALVWYRYPDSFASSFEEENEDLNVQNVWKIHQDIWEVIEDD